MTIIRTNVPFGASAIRAFSSGVGDGMFTLLERERNAGTVDPARTIITAC